jgi:hypothetical protein
MAATARQTAGEHLPRENLFELSLLGGVSEARYRAWRPDVESLPWDHFDARDLTEAERLVARRTWTAASFQEYATAAQHALTVNLLVQARVPLDLSAMASRFSLDELVHAELCARMANALGGGTPLTYTDEEVFPHPAQIDSKDLFAVITERVLHDCCIAETLAGVLLRAAARTATDTLVRGVLWVLARDEALHARFGWIYLEWAGERFDESMRTRLGQHAESHFDSFRAAWKRMKAKPEESASPLSLFGGLSVDEYVRRGEEALDRQVRTGLEAHGIVVRSSR